MQEIKVVLGTLFGDEGKGVTVQWLCKQAIEQGKTVAVIRYSGGPQAAHTIVNDGVEHICSSYGSGVLLGVPTYYISGALFDPICAYNEYKVLKEKMDNVPPIYISTYLECITPYDVISSQTDEKTLKDGTCGKGVWACKERHQSKDYFLYTYSQFLPYRFKDKQFQSVCDYYGMERNPELEEMYVEACKQKFYKLIHDNRRGAKELKDYDVLIFESTQGLLLDAKDGLFPHVTGTQVGLDRIFNFLEHYGFEGKPEVYLITRTYLTRHGNGYIPQAPLNWDLTEKHETNVYNQYQGKFKVGAFEKRLVERAVDRHRLDYLDKKDIVDFNLVITHMDLPLKNGFIEMDNGCEIEKVIVDKVNGLKTVANVIKSCFDINFNTIFYNDSPESNLKITEV